jgi:hypothetical protein
MYGGVNVYEGVSKRFRTESITKYMLTTINTRWEATQRVLVAKLTRLTHKIAIQLHLVAQSCTICSSRCRRPVRKLLDITFVDPRILNLCSRWRKVVSFTPRPLYSQWKSYRYPLGRRLGGPQNRFERDGEEKNSLPLPGIQSWPSSP